jgi:hypothetical protein
MTQSYIINMTMPHIGTILIMHRSKRSPTHEKDVYYIRSTRATVEQWSYALNHYHTLADESRRWPRDMIAIVLSYLLGAAPTPVCISLVLPLLMHCVSEYDHKPICYK